MSLCILLPALFSVVLGVDYNQKAASFLQPNKFRDIHPAPILYLPTFLMLRRNGLDVGGRQGSKCSIDLDLLWSSKLGAGAVTTPIIYDIHADGVKDVIVATTRHFVEAIQGTTGLDQYSLT